MHFSVTGYLMRPNFIAEPMLGVLHIGEEKVFRVKYKLCCILYTLHL